MHTTVASAPGGGQDDRVRPARSRDARPMPRPPLPAFAGPLCAALLIAGTAGCGEEPDNSRWEYTQAQTEGGDVAAVENAGTAVEAGEFNKFFPEQDGGFDMIAEQEKGGTAIWRLEQDETVLATFSITDLQTNPRAKQKFEDATMQIDGYPAVTQGRNTTALLVNDRYQVKALSKDDSFSPGDREAWLQKFDLAGLAAMDALR